MNAIDVFCNFHGNVLDLKQNTLTPILAASSDMAAHSRSRSTWLGVGVRKTTAPYGRYHEVRDVAFFCALAAAFWPQGRYSSAESGSALLHCCSKVVWAAKAEGRENTL